MDLIKQCIYCGVEFNEELALGRWGCCFHPRDLDPATGRFACCGLNPVEYMRAGDPLQRGCTPSDHTDTWWPKGELPTPTFRLAYLDGPGDGGRPGASRIPRRWKDVLDLVPGNSQDVARELLHDLWHEVPRTASSTFFNSPIT